jgi:hypothetical protein
MILKNILLFLIVCGLAGICIFLGSVLGHGLGKVGLFSGAVIGGIVGVALAVWLAARFGLLDRANSGVTLVGGVVGFIVAAVIAVNNLRGPLIPMASVGLIGLGALIGKMLGDKRAA